MTLSINETDAEGKVIVPSPIAKNLGNISILKPEVIDSVKKKYFEKKEQLDSLRGKRKKENVFVKKGGVIMKTWMKYLVIGWSIVSVGLIMVTFQIMKKGFIEERYYIPLSESLPPEFGTRKTVEGNELEGFKVPEGYILKHKGRDLLEVIVKDKLAEQDIYLDDIEFDTLINGIKGINVVSSHRVKNTRILINGTIYAFLIWVLPILVFSLVGMIFSRK